MSAPILALGFEAEPPQAPVGRAEPGFDGLLAMAVSDFLSLGVESQVKPVKRGKKGEAPAEGRSAAELGGFDPSFGFGPSSGVDPSSGLRPRPGGEKEAGVVLDAALGFYAREADTAPDESAAEFSDEDESLPELDLDPEPRELNDNDALAAHLDRMGIDVEVRGLAVPQEPVRFDNAPAVTGTPGVDIESPELADTAAAMDLRALEVRDGVTVRVNDAGQAWEIDVVRHDNTLDLAIRADAPVREIIAAEQDSIRAAVAREGYQLGSLDIAERPVETAQAVKAPEASRSLDNTSSHMSHDNPNPQARREELPPWPAPRPGRRAPTAEPTRQGRLDRDA